MRTSLLPFSGVLGCALTFVLGCSAPATTSKAPQVNPPAPPAPAVQDSHTPLTEAVIAEHKLTDMDLKSVQFYIAGTLNLTQKVKKEDKREIVGGKLVQTAGETIHELLVEKGTPGLYVKTTGSGSSRVIHIAFEKESILQFTLNNGKYQLVGAPQSNGAYKVKFDGCPNEFDLPASDYANAYLLIDRESVNDVTTVREKLSGRKLGDTK
ncbi:MAG TPA: hypothetical protein VGE74_25035 [Gemmata sp.]